MRGKLAAFPLFSLLLQLYYTERSVSASELSLNYTEISVLDLQLSFAILTSLRGCATIVSRVVPLERSFGISYCLGGKRRAKENSI